jgi:hypothetical protein
MTYKVWVKINGVWVLVGEKDSQDAADSIKAGMESSGFPLLVRASDNDPWPKEGELECLVPIGPPLPAVIDIYLTMMKEKI